MDMDTTAPPFVGTRAGVVKDAGAGGEEAKLGIPTTKTKLAELELSLLHLQQNVEIPETNLVVHPVIQRAVESVVLPSSDDDDSLTRIKAQSQGQRSNISHIPSKLLIDSTFLNSLHSHVYS